MSILDGLKTCRKGLHQYSADLKNCPDCQKLRHQKWYAKNADRVRENNRKWHKKNPERSRENRNKWREKNIEQCREYNRCWAKRNSDKLKENSRKWKEDNAEKVRENMREWRKQSPRKTAEHGDRWRKINPQKVRAKSAKRRADKKQATPPWADHAAINKVYEEAIRLEKETGIPHHVDHIYPLKSPYLCGLHIAENLQPLPYSENISKGNRTWPGQLDCQKDPNPLFMRVE